jgi:hypothetical protein
VPEPPGWDTDKDNTSDPGTKHGHLRLVIPYLTVCLEAQRHHLLTRLPRLAELERMKAYVLRVRSRKHFSPYQPSRDGRDGGIEVCLLLEKGLGQAGKA